MAEAEGTFISLNNLAATIHKAIYGRMGWVYHEEQNNQKHTSSYQAHQAALAVMELIAGWKLPRGEQ